MPDTPRRVAIIGGVRIPFARANTAYVEFGNLEMLGAALKALVEKFNLKGETLGEVAAGAVIKHSHDWNLAREATLSSGLDPHTPAYDLQRACGTSLTTVAQLAHRIALGEIDSGIAGGADSASDVPLAYGKKLQRIVLESARGRTFGARFKPWLGMRPRHLKPSYSGAAEPRTGLTMGEHCELMAKEWGISRAEQDELAHASHAKAAAAWKDGFYKDLVVPHGGLLVDNNVRPDASIAKLGQLKPAFDRTAGTLTAGNSTPLTDGAACVLLASEEWARSRGLPVLAWFTHYASAAVDFAGLRVEREGLLMGPTYAVSQMLERARLALQDFTVYEIHEAFAAQVLCNLKAWQSADYCRARLGRSEPLGAIDRAKMNLKGGSVALGHPFAATGARIVASLAKQLSERGAGRGLISICTAGGMGVSAILER
jgi:acetyl-CoA C-acetyltransferase